MSTERREYMIASNSELTDTLSPRDRRVVRDYFDRGYQALQDARYTVDEIEIFLGRPEVAAELQRLSDAFDERKSQLERVRHHIKFDLAKLSPLAVSVLQRALIGFQETRDEDGNLVQTVPPDKQQVETARDLLKLLGIDKDYDDVSDAGGSITALADQRGIHLHLGDSEIGADSAEGAERREGIRRFLSSVLDVAKANAAEEREIIVEAKSGGNGKLRKRERKLQRKKEKRKKKRPVEKSSKAKKRKKSKKKREPA